MSADVGSPGVDTSRSRRRALGAGGTVSNRAVAGALGKGYAGQRAEEVRNEGVMSIGTSSHEQPAAGSGQADSASRSP
jgi:hypothetical protein